jgi:hypothetical protein
MRLDRMTERQVTKAYSDGKVTLKQYHTRLEGIATKRHQAEIAKKKVRHSMSSSKWS